MGTIRLHNSPGFKYHLNTGIISCQIRSRSLTSSKTNVPSPVEGHWTSQHVNEVQKIAVVAKAGTFTLTFDGQTTGAINYNATSSDIESALEALSNISPSDISVIGDAGGPWIVQFEGSYQEVNVPVIIPDGSALLGPNHSITVSIVQQGNTDKLSPLVTTITEDHLPTTMIVSEAVAVTNFRSASPARLITSGTIKAPVDTSTAESQNRKIWRGKVFASRIKWPK